MKNIRKTYIILIPLFSMKSVLVSDIMTRNPVSVSPDTNLLECARKMVRKRVNSLLILDKKILKGFISNRDILWALIKKSKQDLSKIKVKEISPKKIITTKPSSTIEETINRMKKFKFYRIPVVKNGELVGLITIRDILNFYPELSQDLKELDLIKEETKKLKRLRKAKARDVIENGICGECGSPGTLYRVNGMLICGSCMSSV